VELLARRNPGLKSETWATHLIFAPMAYTTEGAQVTLMVWGSILFPR
jgi:hypothetical protein